MCLYDSFVAEEEASVGPVTESRIISLVPSITELVCDLDLADQLVGRTGFCIHPWETVRHIPKVGGTKDLKLEKIAELEPTHVIVNVDENRIEDVDAIEALGPEIIVTHPIAPEDNLTLYRRLGSAFGREHEAEELCSKFESALSAVQQTELEAQNVLYLIWRAPYMTISRETYISNTLALINWHTVPASATERYPTVDPRSFVDSPIDRVLLSSEPFHFKEHHIPELQAAFPTAKVSLIDGEMTSWYGSRAIQAMDYLANFAKAN